ncbi:MAG: NAD(P)H-hydrate dehydratase [Dorea sp.]|nr:NAD(P)H-hydrate dehydratase [Dorea sp.]
MRYLPGARQMKKADQYTIKTLGVPSLELMERAAAACVAQMKERRMDLDRVCVVCGSGNNGGDGFAIARMLHGGGYSVQAVMAGSREHCTAECREQIRLFEEAGGIVGNEFKAGEYSVIVDALFGVGLSRNVEGRYAELIEAMNESRAVKFAVDIPSGISADTGNVLGTAFSADITVTFQEKKFGMGVYPGKAYAGEVAAADIGISGYTLKEDPETACELSGADYRALLPVREPDSNKGTYGKVLVIAGSAGMCGAAYFNAKSAYLAGAGLVRIYTAEENRSILQTLLPEAVITAYKGYDEEELIGLLSWAGVVCIGSGMGTGETAEKIVEAVLKHNLRPCVADADGLNFMAAHPEYLASRIHDRYILTPHMKEMSRLAGIPVEEIKKDRLKALRSVMEGMGSTGGAGAPGMTCILKDSSTVTYNAGNRPCLNSSGNSAMAKAGSGDVLAGIAAGLLAQKGDCFESAVLAAYLHGRAGDLAREEKGAYSVMAEDIMKQISSAMKQLSEQKGGTGD